MSYLSNLALTETSNLPIKHVGTVHGGKVRSVYWLSEGDSRRLIETNGYRVHPNAQLGIMVISDRISAFDVNWHSQYGLAGVPGKGSGLNAVSKHWFDEFDKAGLAGNHIVDVPHPLIWIVQRAEPVKVEAIAREYITGSMLRDYKTGIRNFCGIQLPEGLKDNQKLEELIVTPTTKGVLKGIQGVKEEDDTNITREQILENWKAFGFKSPEDVEVYEELLKQGFGIISKHLAAAGQIFVDTKFEFGYVPHYQDGIPKLVYIDEVGTPDSSRMWDAAAYAKDKVVENSKEGFRQFLLGQFGREKNSVLLDKAMMHERKRIAKEYEVPVDVMLGVAETYAQITERITMSRPPVVQNARAEIEAVLKEHDLMVEA